MKKSRLWRGILAAVAACVLTLPVSASGEGEGVPSYQLIQRGSGFPIRVEGTVSELGKDSLTLENSQVEDGYRKIILNVTDQTWILDAKTGEARSFLEVAQGDELCAWVDPAMTKSLPPVAAAAVLLIGPEEKETSPVYAEVQTVTKTTDGVDLSVTGDLVLHLKSDMSLLAAPGRETPELTEIRPGTRLLSWHSAVALSMPAQAVPEKVLVFPYTYEGWVTVRGLSVAINGEWQVFSGNAAPQVEADRLMVPVRTLAETLGCSVSWEPYTNRVSVFQNGSELYHFTIGGEQAVRGEVTVGLLVKTQAENGVTRMALDDFISLQGLKLENG